MLCWSSSCLILVIIFNVYLHCRNIQQLTFLLHSVSESYIFDKLYVNTVNEMFQGLHVLYSGVRIIYCAFAFSVRMFVCLFVYKLFHYENMPMQ